MTTITVPAGDYYLSTADSEAESLIDTIETLLNAAGLGSTYTVSLDAGEGGSGKVTITSDGAGGVTEVAIVWTDTGLRDVLGYETDGDVSGALSHESSGQARSLWISDAFGQGYNGAGDGWEESDYGAAEHFAGPVFGFRANRKTVNALLFEASARSRTWQDEEVTDGESLQRFWRDVLFCESPASKVAGGPVRWHPDAGDDASYREYRVTDSGSFAPTEHVANQSTSWTATIRRLLLRSSVGSPTPKQGRLEGRITVPTGGYSFELTEVVAPSGPTHSALFSPAADYASIANASEVANVDGLDEFTVEFWWRPGGVSGNLGLVTDFAAPNNMLCQLSGGDPRFAVRLAGGYEIISGTPSIAVAINTWYHLAYIWDGANGEQRIYIHGGGMSDEKVAENLSAGTGAATVGAGDWSIATIDSGASQNSSGHFSQVRLWGKVRSLAEIQSDRETLLDGTETDLLAHWSLNNTWDDDVAGGVALTNSGGAFDTEVPF